MGLKIPELPDDFEIGNDCLACWPSGSTPLVIYARFWDVEACPGCDRPPLGIPFVLTQSLTLPCLFEGLLNYKGHTWSCVYWLDVNFEGERHATIDIHQTMPVQTASFFGVGAPCDQAFDNEFTECNGWSGKNGRCIATIYSDPIIILLTSGYHFVTRPGIFYEKQDVGMDHAIYRIAHTDDHTNVMILLDKEAIEYE